MSASNGYETLPMALEARESIHVECYLRSQLPGSVAETVNTVLERLERLRDYDRIDSYRVTHWPPAHRRLEQSADTDGATREELVTEFERWADRRGVTLEPAFRRRESPAPICGDDSYERLRVPVVALAVYDGADEAGSLRGVVPCTEHRERGRERTYSVAEWLAAVEPPEPTGQAHAPETTG